MKPDAAVPAARWWRDPLLAAACAGGPAAWLGLAWAGLPLGDAAWALHAPWRLAWLCAAGPVIEELVFRGWMQPLLAQALARAAGRARYAPAHRPLANIATSLAFAALHLPAHPVMWAAAVFVPSYVFGYFRDRHGGLASPIALHVLYNTGYFLLFGH